MYFDKSFARSRTLIIAFACPQNAERNIAGLPAAVRAVVEAARTGAASCVVTAGAGWKPSEVITSEIARLAGDIAVSFANPDTALGRARVTSGEELCARQSLTGQPQDNAPSSAREMGYSADTMLRLAQRRAMLGTQKAADGIVSRTINRPISRAISGFLMRFSWIRPIHATGLTAVAAIFMLAALLSGGQTGLLIGALLFQAASIIDGVDGEIARATYRSSRFGAAADSLVDAFTNIAFIGGVVANLAFAGRGQEAAVGGLGLSAMAVGLTLLGLKSRRSQGNFSFDFVKNEFGQRPSRIKKALTWLTMRDFYALVGCVLVATGHAGLGLAIFAVVALGWLGVVCTVLALHSAPDVLHGSSTSTDPHLAR